MTDEEKFSDLKNLNTADDKRRAHKMLDELNVPRGPLEKRIDLLTWRYPKIKSGGGIGPY